MLMLGIVFSCVVLYVGHRVHGLRRHKQAMHQKFEHRIHVNGIRGKSSVTRLIAATLREGGIRTAAKTTGTAARVLVNHDYDAVVQRKEADIAEQKRLLDIFTDESYKMHTGEEYKAVVFECMAINPLYQRYLEDKIMYSTIGVITNVREDHTDLLGETLPEIAKSLSNTVPLNGHLITAETNEELLAVLKEVCDRRGTKLHAVGNMRIGEKHMAKFQHFEYKANVAIALEVAKIVGIERNVALAGMQKALPDPGAFVLKKVERKDKVLHWANLFAINDRESFVFTTDALNAKVSSKTKKAVILNNRQDRPERVSQFVDIAVNSVGAHYLFTFGDYEKQVQAEVDKHKPSHEVKIVNMGNTSEFKSADGDALLDKIAETIEKECLLFGAVNIHTPQAQALLGVLEGKHAH